MAYNGFPATYQPMYYPQQYQQSYPQQPVQQPQQMNNNMIWVSGEAGAKAYLVAPNTSVQLWDSERQTVYIKSADSSGMPTMKVLDYTIRDSGPQSAVNAAISPSQPQAAEYVGKAETDAIKAEIDALRAEIDTFKADLYGIAGKKSVTRKKEAMSDE